jgi:glutamate-1-semialdehyde 2,1-aminomutase
MMSDMSDAVMATLVADYLESTPSSRARWNEAKRYLPGGDSRTATFFAPHPLAVERGHGASVVDADGRELLDLLNNYSALILGHANPKVTDAVIDGLPRGTAFSAAHENATELAREIVGRIDSIDRIRFCNSGSEAAMSAVRVARAYTGRPLLVKAFGGYHGSYDQVDQWMSEASPARGGVNDLSEHVRVMSYGDLDSLRAAVEGREHDVAAVLLEPVLGSAGIFMASAEYLQEIRAWCDEVGALLILDEIITFRLGRGGAQAGADVKPDLTTLGKIIGGGFPIGAFGGREDVMAILDPRQPGALPHSGTYNANPISMRAGAVTLSQLDTGAFERLDALGERLETGITNAIASRRLPLGLTRAGSLLQLHGTAEPRPPRLGSPPTLPASLRALHLALCLEGVHIAPRGFLNCSLAMSDNDVDRAVGAIDRALGRLAPLIAG